MPDSSSDKPRDVLCSLGLMRNQVCHEGAEAGLCHHLHQQAGLEAEAGLLHHHLRQAGLEAEAGVLRLLPNETGHQEGAGTVLGWTLNETSMTRI